MSINWNSSDTNKIQSTAHNEPCSWPQFLWHYWISSSARSFLEDARDATDLDPATAASWVYFSDAN